MRTRRLAAVPVENQRMVGQVEAEACGGGPIAAVREGDMIRIDLEKRTIELEVSAEEIANRMKDWRKTRRALASKCVGNPHTSVHAEHVRNSEKGTGR